MSACNSNERKLPDLPKDKKTFQAVLSKGNAPWTSRSMHICLAETMTLMIVKGRSVPAIAVALPPLKSAHRRSLGAAPWE
jgi:hypothetical protein